VLAYHLSSIGPRLLQSSWFATSAFLEKNTAAVRAFARVMQAASAYCNTHQAQTAELLATFTKMDPATVAGMSRVMFASNLDPAQIQPLIDVAAKYKTIDKAFDAHEFIAHLS
jgi:ABC-type nitrate/sulfonate/bicarbonate transport system substrate-binding protein